MTTAAKPAASSIRPTNRKMTRSIRSLSPQRDFSRSAGGRRGVRRHVGPSPARSAEPGFRRRTQRGSRRSLRSWTGAAHVQHAPGARHFAAGHMHERRLARGEGLAQRLFQRRGVGRPISGDAEALGQLARNPDSSGRRRSNGCRTLLLQRLTLPKPPLSNTTTTSGICGARGGQLLTWYMKPPSPAIDSTARRGRACLDTERGSKAPAEIVLIAGRQERARRIAERRGAWRNRLGDLVDENAVLRQRGADRLEEGELRLELPMRSANQARWPHLFSRGARCAVASGSPASSARSLGRRRRRSRLRPGEGVRVRRGSMSMRRIFRSVSRPHSFWRSAAACRSPSRRRPPSTADGRSAADASRLWPGGTTPWPRR